MENGKLNATLLQKRLTPAAIKEDLFRTNYHFGLKHFKLKQI